MQSEHIENLKLYRVAAELEFLTAAEIEHLGYCEECLELIRMFVRQRIPRGC